MQQDLSPSYSRSLPGPHTRPGTEECSEVSVEGWLSGPWELRRARLTRAGAQRCCCAGVPGTVVVPRCLAYLDLSPGAGRIWCCPSQREPSTSAPWVGGPGGSTVAGTLPFSENEAQWSHGTHSLGSVPGADLFLGCPSSLPTVAPRRAGPRETQGWGGGVMHWSEAW